MDAVDVEEDRHAAGQASQLCPQVFVLGRHKVVLLVPLTCSPHVIQSAWHFLL
jgi:hypothetical protein